MIGGVPEKEPDAVLVLRGQHLGFDVFRPISLGAPAAGLQPVPDDHSAALVFVSNRAMDSPMKWTKQLGGEAE